MAYLCVYKKDETDFDHLGLCVLDSARDVAIHETINGEYTLTFTMQREDEKWQYMQYDNLVRADGQLFRIRETTDGRSADGKLTASVTCYHVWYEAGDCKYIPMTVTEDGDAEADGWIGKSPAWILEAAFDGTPFTVGTVEVTTPTDIFAYKTNPAAIVTQLIENVGGELVRDNYTVSLLQERGENNGVQLRTGKNLKGITRIMDESSVITRLYPYGTDDLDITSVNNGVAYIDSPLADQYSYPKEGYLDYEIADAQELLDKALLEWSSEEKDGIDKPKVTYEVEATSLSGIGLGDRVRVMDEVLGIDVYSRVVEMTYYPFEPQRGTVKLSNHMDANASLFDKVASGTIKVEHATLHNGTIKTQYVDGFRGKLASDFEEDMAKPFVVHDYGDIWVDDVHQPTSALAIVNGKFALSNQKKPNGDWDWRILGGEGTLVADAVAADWVYAGKVRADQVEAGQMEIINQNTDGSKTIISPEGVKVQHTENDYTLFNKNGTRRYIDGQLVPLTWLTNFVSATPHLSQYWNPIDDPVGVLLPGLAWKRLAIAYLKNPSLRDKMVQAQVVSGEMLMTVPSNAAGCGWLGDLVRFGYDYDGTHYSNLLLCPTDDSGYTTIETNAGDVYVSGDGAVALIGGGSWYRYLNADNVWRSAQGNARVTALFTGTPDYIE